ncbi:ATP synthase subunit b 2 [Jannaschia pagri]|uniref:ATP synthase subunit b n=1 Tax=Jannaschia pagri TaxID=2829797 RepID=A0ABQ4NKD1_9RHOB|nr:MULTISPECIES: F0F1 ATP synthase subunit B' [unclassified Jannaschia]GIT91017.1 ATP synthase subunit b 2 [Jannaschia sp. AI_61]GIT94849.1 ATP synthase subunit b 2 [Jannaschia sp. AI_62]
MADVVTETASACVNELGHAVGMPQLCGDWFLNQIFWLLVTLAVIYLVLTKVALPRIGAVLAERSGTISNDLAAAEDLNRQAAEAETAYNQALAEARAEAQRISGETRAAIKADLDAAIAKADEEIAAKTAESEAQIAEIQANAATSVAQVARDIAADIVTAVGGTPDQAAIDAAVDTRVKGN